MPSNIAAEAAARSHAVLLVDSDPHTSTLLVERMASRGHRAAVPAERPDERLSIRVAPACIDHERVLPSGGQGPAHLLVRRDAGLHPPRIEQQRISRAILVPQIDVERQTRIGNRAP